VAAVLNAAFLWAIARALRLYAMDVNHRTGGVAIGLPLRIDVATASYQTAVATRAESPAATGGARVWSRSAQPKPPPPDAE
jgi:hypothetical protein